METHHNKNPKTMDFVPLNPSFTISVRSVGFMRIHAFTKYFAIVPIATPEGLISPTEVRRDCLHCPEMISSNRTKTVSGVSLFPRSARLTRKESRSTNKRYRTG